MPFIITNGDAFCHQTKNRAVQIVEDPALATQFRDESSAQRLLDRATKKLKGFQIVASTPIPAPAEEAETSKPNEPETENTQTAQKRERRGNRRQTTRSKEPTALETAAVQTAEDETAKHAAELPEESAQHAAEFPEESAQHPEEADEKESSSDPSPEVAHAEDTSSQSSRRSSRRRRSRSRGARGQAQNNSVDVSSEDTPQTEEADVLAKQPSAQIPEPSVPELRKPEHEELRQKESSHEESREELSSVPDSVPADDIFAAPSAQQESPEKPARNQRRGRGNNRHMQKIDANHRRRMWTTQERYQVYNSTEGHCGICGCFIPLEEYTIDHIIPLSKGGTNDLSNLQPCCSFCNKAKDDSMGEEFYFRIARIFLHQAELRYSKKQYKKLKKLLKELEG